MSPAIDKRKIVLKKRPSVAADTNKAIAEYFQSKKEEQSTIKHYPEWDVVRGEPTIELMRVRRELLTADAELAAKRLEYQARRAHADHLWRELRDRETSLRTAFVKFDEFVRENREKRERAERKVHDEKERQKIRQAEIAEFEKSLEHLESACNKMQSEVDKYKPFQEYLERVVDTNEFQSIAEIFNRYETLIAARSALVENQDDNLLTLENTSAQLQKMTEEKSQSLMELNSRLAQLQSRHERARAKALHWETVVARVKEVAAKKELEETQVRASIWNLYRQICRRKGLPIEAGRDDLEEQLLHVKRTVLELGKIVRATKRRAAREERERLARLKEAAAAKSECTANNNNNNNQLRPDDTVSTFRSSLASTRKN